MEITLPPMDVTLYMVYAALGLVAFLIIATGIVYGIFTLLALIFTPRTPKPEIVPNGLVIFDV